MLLQQNNVTSYALKVILTIPIIERYQTENLLNKTGFKELIKNSEI
jgi:hypothetical protein